MKKILGLDLGTNSIGWALVEQDFETKSGKILGMGSRIIPMSQDILGKFDSGQSISQTAERTSFRSMRRLRQRSLLRRERLHRVLNILGFLPQHYANAIDFEYRLGQFLDEKEAKLAYTNVSGKFEFLFKESFREMVADFRENQPQMFYKKKNGEESKIPFDWTVYYLRKKALTQKIRKEELAWLILHFNQKRGYYQLRGEEEAMEENKSAKYYALKVVKVEPAEKGKNEDIWYNVHLENGWIYRRSSKIYLDWEGIIKEFIVTEDLNPDGSIKSDKDGNEKRSFKAVDSEKDWIAIKKSTEEKILDSGITVGAFIYETLLQKPDQKIRGKLIRTIERKFYKEELRLILEAQKEFHPELKDEKLYLACIDELYFFNESHKKSIANRSFVYLFLEDIIFYQRPLKRKKSLISDCPFENRFFKGENSELIKKPIKCIAKSNPLYQEFRVIQWLKNLRIYRKAIKGDIDITGELINSEAAQESLFEWLNEKLEISQEEFLKFSGFALEERVKEWLGAEGFKAFRKDKEKGLSYFFRWNFVEDKTYPMNETRGAMLKALKKNNCSFEFLSREIEENLWHILYSVEDPKELDGALKKFAHYNQLPESFAESFRKFPRMEKEYGSFSAKAIKKLLPLMRFGKYWSENEIDSITRSRIEKIINGEVDEKIQNRVREKAINLQSFESFMDLPLWLASYIVYDRHSEISDIQFWKNPRDIELLKQHSLRNPIVEQVVNETLQTVKEIWDYFGKGQEDYFDEIHVELGREMKNPAGQRQRMTQRMAENENTNNRVKALLEELLNDNDVENVRPYSPSQQELLKIFEEGIYESEHDQITLEEINRIRKKTQPNTADIRRYKLWLEQGYKSPYTGNVIPLSKLFTPAFEIEHIIPQSRFFDDSLSNKIICEAEVNSLKDNQLAFEFIKNNPGLKVELSWGKTVELLHPDVYEENVIKYFAKNQAKKKKLLLEEIPEAFIERQMNDSRYISKVVKSLLSNIVRKEGEQEGIAKNLVASTGAITSRLKQDWGLNAIWNDLITPRFERLNHIAGYEKYGRWEHKEGKRVFQINTLEKELVGLNKKRIDHRHHALDALVVACSTRNHINYLNNDNANEKDQNKPLRYDLRNKLRRIEEVFAIKAVNGQLIKTKRNVAREFHKPWKSFAEDAKLNLYKIIVSFKKNTRVINKTVNLYQKWVSLPDGSYKKAFVTQTKGDHWAIRKPLHIPMPYGRKEYCISYLKISENLGKRGDIVDEIIKSRVEQVFNQNKRKISETKKFLKSHPIIDEFGKIVISTDFLFKNHMYRKRFPILKLSNRSINGGITNLEQMIKFLNKIPDLKLKNEFLIHLQVNQNDIDKAFSVEGIESFNKKRKIPVKRIPIAESGEKRFQLGTSLGKKHKWVEAEAGTNLFFGIYSDVNKFRDFDTFPLNLVIERQKQGLTSCPEVNKNLKQLLFDLSPNDLVFVPNKEEEENPDLIDFRNLTMEQLNRIYKFVSCTGSEGHFVFHSNASEIVKNENGTNSKSERILDFPNKKTIYDNSKNPVQIKAVCWKIEIDRLGNIKRVLR